MVSIPVAQWTTLLRGHRKLGVMLKVSVVFGLFWLYVWRVLDPDFGWHLKTGEYILRHWVPAHDLYTYTAKDFSWMNHEWGNDVVVAILNKLGGYTLLTTVFAGLWTASICLYRIKLRLSVLVIALLAFTPYVGVRPAVWTVLGVATLIELATRNTRTTRRIIPVLFLVWANLHGGFIIGMGLLVYFALKYRNRQWLWVLGICTAATCINPYGPLMYDEIARTFFGPALHHQINEWRAFHLLPTTWPFIVLWMSGFWLWGKQKFSNWLGLAPLFLIASLSSTRNMLLFVVAGLRDIDAYWTNIKIPQHLDKPRRIVVGVCITLSLGIIGFFLITNLTPWRDREAVYPRQAVQYLHEHGCPGNLFNDFNYGGYLIWKLPSMPIYIDGRMVTWHNPSGQNHLDRYFSVVNQPSALKSEFASYNIRCALLTSGRHSTAIEALQKENWQIVNDQQGIVLLVAPH